MPGVTLSVEAARRVAEAVRYSESLPRSLGIAARGTGPRIVSGVSAGDALTPSGGIPAATSTGSPPVVTMGSASCTLYADNGSGVLSSTGTSITLYNSVPTAVGGSKVVTWITVNGLPRVVVEPC